MSELEYSFYGRPYSSGCPGCNRINPQPQGLDIVYANKHVRVHQDYAIPIPFMFVIETTRHVAKLSDLTPTERTAFLKAVASTKLALTTSGVTTATLLFEERSSHAHAWWFPNPGPGVRFSEIKHLMDEAKSSASPEKIAQVEAATQRIKAYYAKR